MFNQLRDKFRSSKNKKKKILFFTTPYHAGVVEIAGKWVPLYLVNLAGAARDAGFEPIIYDAMTKEVGHKEIIKKIKQVKPDFVGVSSITCTLPDAIEILENTKKINPNIKTLIGGIHPTFMYEEVLNLTDSIDVVVRGEAEVTLKELLPAMDAGVDLSEIKGLAYWKDGVSGSNGGELVVTPERPLMAEADLNHLSKAWDLLDWAEYPYHIIPDSRMGALDTSRGCTKDCTFCSQRLFWKQSWRGRTPESLIADMEEQMKYGVDTFLLTDDYPTIDPERWERWLDMIIERDMDIHILMETRAEDIIRDRDILYKYRKAGVIHIYIGVEAGDQDTLDWIRKDLTVNEGKEALRLLSEASIMTETSMIMGYPDETKENIANTIKLAIEYNPDFCHFLAISPWPYADMYKDLKDHVEVFDYKKYNLIEPIVKPTAMTLREVDDGIVDGYKQFYMEKMTHLKDMTDTFRRDYVLVAMQRMMTNSFITKKLGDLGSIPEDVDAELKRLAEESGIDLSIVGKSKSKCPVAFIGKPFLK